MGFIARRLIKQNLNLLDVLVEDTNNTFFNVVEIPTTFTQGRSSFKIFGSQFLKQDVQQPSSQDLENFYIENQSKYIVEDIYSFSHYFFSKENDPEIKAKLVFEMA